MDSTVKKRENDDPQLNYVGHLLFRRVNHFASSIRHLHARLLLLMCVVRVSQRSRLTLYTSAMRSIELHWQLDTKREEVRTRIDGRVILK